MARMEWHQAIKQMMKNLVKVSTRGDGHGSGVLVPPPTNAPGNCCVLTAFHVIDNAEKTGATIDLFFEDSKSVVELPSLRRVIYPCKERDQALIIFNSSRKHGEVGCYHLPENPGHYHRGIEFGWLGWPRIAPNTVCFFRGVVSAYLEKDDVYLVDGASIHGNSGGPVFCCRSDQTICLAGIVTGYTPNQVSVDNGAAKQALPGLSVFRTINPLIDLYESENKRKQQKLPAVSAPVKPPKSEEGGNGPGDLP